MLALVVGISSHRSARAEDVSTGIRFLSHDEHGASCRLSVVASIDEVNQAACWQNALSGLFAFYDRDADGQLSEAEAARLPSSFALRQIVWNPLSPVAGRLRHSERMDTNGDGTIGLSEMIEFYQNAEVDGLTIGVGANEHAKLLDSALTAAFTDVEPISLAILERRMNELDVNRDELLSPVELQQSVAYPGSTCSLRWPRTLDENSLPELIRSLPLRIVSANHENDGLAGGDSQIIEARFSTSNLSTDNHENVVPDSQTAAEANDSAVRCVVDQPGLWIGVRVDSGTMASKIAAVEARIRSAFDVHDADRNGSLTIDEAEPNNASLVCGLFDLADRNDNRAVDHQELAAWLSVQRRLAESQITVSVLDLRSEWFAALDANFDGALSLRELRGLCDEPLASQTAGKPTVDGTPPRRRLLIVISHGRPRDLLATRTAAGPTWFQALDRNQDRDVSRQEFIGPAAAFDRYDADSDGLISASEASR
ncbi:MAG: EF-hand domain-containing protein [Planctomycetales bacterium]|nr:EF-hand domain-containing protein [Planctomycetales bacterium]